MRRLGIVAVAMVVVVTACSGEKAENKGAATGGPGPTTATGPVTIDVWHQEVASNATAFQKLIDRFNASQDEVTVRLLFHGTEDELLPKLLSSLRSGQVPARL
jgi:ABC-type glycerol-3-phosphate transport system substrate-binding protein